MLYQKTPPILGLASTLQTGIANPVDISALAGAVNLAAIDGSINITGTNVSLAGLTAATTGLSTTVIGAMNSSTLDIAKKTVNLSDKTTSKLDIASLAATGTASPAITSQSFGAGQLGGLATTGSTILSAGTSTQLNMTGLVSGTDTLATSVTDSLQSMNVFNMALNMAPLAAGVTIAATVDPKAWFLNSQTGIVNLAGVTIATTTIGAMNSSLTSLGAKLR
jgi:hypothetical protein